MKQLDIFGNEVSLGELKNQEKKHSKSLKQQFRERYGYNKNNHCEDCKHFVVCHQFTTTFYKCRKLMMTNQSASNISGHDIACNLFENREG